MHLKVLLNLVNVMIFLVVTGDDTVLLSIINAAMERGQVFKNISTIPIRSHNIRERVNNID